MSKFHGTVDLNQMDKPVYENEYGLPICEPCHKGYHEHHRQHVGHGENVGFGEADCKNLIDSGQCCCYKQPSGDRYENGVPDPYSKIKCDGCKEIVKGLPCDFYEKSPMVCKECGLGWEINEGGGGWAPSGKIPIRAGWATRASWSRRPSGPRRF